MKKILAVFLSLVSLVASAQIHEGAMEAYKDAFGRMSKNVDENKHVMANGVPFLALQGGASICQGEFGRLRANFPGATGFTAFGGVGKELIFNRDYKDKMTWHAGLGYYVATDRTYCANLDLMAVKAASISDVGLLAQVELNYFLPRCPRLGFFCGFGVGFGEWDRDEPKKLWEFNLGISLKLFAH